MKNSETYFHNFESIDQKQKIYSFIAGAGMDHRLVRAIRLPDSEYNKPLLLIFLVMVTQRDPQVTALNLIVSF